MTLMHLLDELPEYSGGLLGLLQVGHMTRSSNGSMLRIIHLMVHPFANRSVFFILGSANKQHG